MLLVLVLAPPAQLVQAQLVQAQLVLLVQAQLVLLVQAQLVLLVLAQRCGCTSTTLQRRLIASQPRAGGTHGTAFVARTRIGTCVRSAAGRWPRSHVVAGPKSAKRTSRSHTSLARDACSP